MVVCTWIWVSSISVLRIFIILSPFMILISSKFSLWTSHFRTKRAKILTESLRITSLRLLWRRWRLFRTSRFLWKSTTTTNLMPDFLTSVFKWTKPSQQNLQNFLKFFSLTKKPWKNLNWINNKCLIQASKYSKITIFSDYNYFFIFLVWINKEIGRKYPLMERILHGIQWRIPILLYRPKETQIPPKNLRQKLHPIPHRKRRILLLHS